MARVKRALKIALAHGLYALGLLQLWQRVALRRRAVVLMYHRVLSKEERRQTGSHPGIVVGTESFAEQMALLRRRFTVLSIDQFIEHLHRRQPFPNSACVITFDDGWLDNAVNAWPVLQRHLIPAVVFLPVDFIGKNHLFWRESLTHLLTRAIAASRTDAGLAERLRMRLRPMGLAPLVDLPEKDSLPRIISAVASWPAERREEAEAMIDTLEADLGSPLAPEKTPDRFMSWSQVQELRAGGISFGGHGASHRLLGELSLEDAIAEIQTTKRALQACGESEPTFSYPNGSFTAPVAASVKATGFRLGFTTKPGPVACDDDPFALRRINIHEDMTGSAPMFLARVVGLF